MFYCFFEQSGTFKNELIKLGYQAEDYDILNDFNQTDHVMDLFKEINFAYEGKESLFDKITSNDFILAFFPCTRFEDQSLLLFRGDNCGMKNWSLEQKLEYDLKLHNELHELYSLVTKLVLVCERKHLKLILENPYSTQHYLYRYWALKPQLIDKDRREMGDYYSKPTQYFFINCEPKNNFIFESVYVKRERKIEYTHNKVKRSMISEDYASRFLREFVLDESL